MALLIATVRSVIIIVTALLCYGVSVNVGMVIAAVGVKTFCIWRRYVLQQQLDLPSPPQSTFKTC